MASTSVVSPSFLTTSRFAPNLPSTPLSLPTFSKPSFPTLRKQPKFLLPLQATKKKRNPWLDLFYDGEDPGQRYGSVLSEGKQDEDDRPPEDPKNPYGFLKFPAGYNVEISSLGSKLRGDVRRCCCIISGGVYENLLFFPAIQLLKNRYPGVQIDILASARGKQVYELNKNVRWATVYDPDDDWPEPAEYLDMVGVLKNRYYDLILSTKVSGLGHAAFLFMTSARDRVSYVFPNVNSAGAGLLLSETFTPESTNLSEGGYNMYRQMVDWLGRETRTVPFHATPPLTVALSRALKNAVEEKCRAAGVEKGKYVVVHGIESDSHANMRSRGDADSVLDLYTWARITGGLRETTPLFVIPHEKERENVMEMMGENACVVHVTTPGQLAAVINDSAGVISTNTAAVHLAAARNKPTVALYGSHEKGQLFAPTLLQDNDKFTCVASKTGNLHDIDVDDVISATKVFSAA